MRLTYSIIYIVLIIALLACTVLARLSGRPARKSVCLLEASLIPPIVGNLLIISSGTRLPALIGCYIYFLGMDLVMFALINFTNAYCKGIGDGSHKPTVVYIPLAIDAIQMLLNPFFGHAFDIKAIEYEGSAYYTRVPRIGQTFHRIVDYGAFLCIILIFLLAIIITPKIYREKYLIILVTLLLTGLLQTYFIFSKIPIDRSMIGYGIFGMIIFYFALFYRPLRLLDRLLSDIVSDLSDAFYIFDSNNTCIWANDQGCKLVDFSGDEYEKISEKLKQVFDFNGHLEEKSVKRTVTVGNDTHYYMLEENQAKDDSGKLNGLYLRIQDVTEGELELIVKDKQIGEISQEAYKDALTGVGSKAAYNKAINELNADIKNGLTEFAIVMVDMNDLKLINDDYGHKSGDLYIKGCCHHICEAFKHSPVFRIGGDEFIAILRGKDFESRVQNVDSLREVFEKCSNDATLDPWLRYSAAVGLAEYASDDNSYDLVFKRADKAMYDDKKSFKKEHGSYR